MPEQGMEMRSVRTTSAAPALENVFDEKSVKSALHGADPDGFVINRMQDDDFDFGSPSLWGTDVDKSMGITSDSIIRGDNLRAQHELRKLRNSTVEKNRAYVEMNIPSGTASHVFSLLTCLQCTGVARFMPEDLAQKLQDRKIVSDVAGALIPVLICVILCGCEKDIDPDNKFVGRTLGIVVLIAGWWLAAPWPDIATSWTPVWLFPMAGIISVGAASSKYTNNTTMLLTGAFLVDLCIEESGLGTRIGLMAIQRFGNKPVTLILGFMTIAWALSMFCSNTSVCMMLMPFVLSIIERIDEANKDSNADDAKRFGKGALLGVAYACSIGGMATTIGTPPNLVLAGFMADEFGSEHEPSFTEWFLMCAPLAFIMLLLTFMVIVLKWCRNLNISVPVDVATKQLTDLGDLTRDEKVVAFIQLAQIIFWFTRKESVPGSSGWSEEKNTAWKGDSGMWGDGGVALFFAFLLFLVPSGSRPGEKILTHSMTKHLPWDILMMMGGGFAIAEAVKVSGTAIWLADHLGNWAKNLSIIPFLMVLCFVVTFLTEIASNTATASIILPVLAPAAAAADMHPLALLIPACLACSTAFMLPMATPPNAVIFSMKRLTIYEMMSTGIYVNCIAGLLMPILVAGVLFPAGGIGSMAGADKLPGWADIYGDSGDSGAGGGDGGCDGANTTSTS